MVCLLRLEGVTFTSCFLSFSFAKIAWTSPKSHPKHLSCTEWVRCSSSVHTLCQSPPFTTPPTPINKPPWAMGNGSYKGNWESFYIRLLLVLAAIYDSTGSSDVGYRAKGEQAVSSKAIQRLVTLKLFPFSAIKLRLEVNPPHVGPGGNEAPSPRLQMIQGVRVCFFWRKVLTHFLAGSFNWWWSFVMTVSVITPLESELFILYRSAN